MRISDWSSYVCSSDLPLHTVFRALLNPLFSPPRMRAMEDKVRKAARHHIASFKDKGKCDFIRDFAFPFPVSIFLDLIDLQHEDTARFMTWEHDLMHESDLDTVDNPVRTVTGTVRDIIADRRRKPSDDFISNGLPPALSGRPHTYLKHIGNHY